MQAIRNVLHGGGSGAAPQHGDKFNFEVDSLQMSPGVPAALNDKRFNPYLSIWRVGDKVALAKTRSIKENVLGLGVINFSETHDIWCNPGDNLVIRLYDDNFIKDTIIAEAPINLQSLMTGVSQPIQLFPVADRFRPTTGVAGGPGVAGGGALGGSGMGMGGSGMGMGGSGLGGPGVASGGLGGIPLCTVMCKARLLQAGGGGQTGIPGVGKQAVGGTGTGVGGPGLAAGGLGAGGLGAGGLGAGGVGASGLGGGGLAGTQQQSGFGSGYGTTQQAGYAGGVGSAPATGSAYGSGVTSSSVAPMSGGGLAAGGLGAGGLGSGIAPGSSSYDSSYSRTSTSQTYGSTGVLPQSGAVSSSGLMGSGLPQQQQGVGGISTTGVSQSASDIGGLSKPTTFTTGASTSGIGQQQGLQPGRGY